MNKEQLVELLKIVICPISGGKLEYHAETNILISPTAKVYYRIEDGIPILLKNEAYPLEDTLLTDSLETVLNQD